MPRPAWPEGGSAAGAASVGAPRRLDGRRDRVMSSPRAAHPTFSENPFMSSSSRLARTAAVLLALAATAPAAHASVSTVTTPNPGTGNTIGGLTAFPTDDVWAVGTSSSPTYNGCHGRTLTARFTGNAFTEILET